MRFPSPGHVARRKVRCLPGIAPGVVPVLFLLSTGCVSSPPPDARTEVRRANDSFEANARARDVEKLVREFYDAEPIVAYGGTRIARGVQEARAAWREILERGTIRLETARFEESCDLAAEIGRWTLRVEAEEGDHREQAGVYHVVWRRADGRWRAVQHSFFPGKFKDAQ